MASKEKSTAANQQQRSSDTSILGTIWSFVQQKSHHLSYLGFLVGLCAVSYTSLIAPRAKVFGLNRPRNLQTIHGVDKIKWIPNTAVCEDLHHHLPSNQIYAACQDDVEQRFHWFPPLAVFDNSNLNQGSITVIDPTTFTSKKLKLKGFEGPFITHGIDIFSSSDEPEALYIFAVNHLPNPLHIEAVSQEALSPNKARSQIEIFKHQLGSEEAEFTRSVRHPLIRTPNDIYATGKDEFYVTNDHYYREGKLRLLEDLSPPELFGWTDTVFVKVNSPKSGDDGEAGLTVTQALKGIHNNNGLGHGSRHNPQEVLIGDAIGGIMHRAKRSHAPAKFPKLHILDRFQLDSTIDNPSYYEDNYATAESNASGYVLPGLGRAIDSTTDWRRRDQPVPVMVWHLKQDGDPNNKTTGGWTPHLIFQDPGHNIRSSSGAVIVGIDPEQNFGKKQGWLFVSGFISESVVVAKIDL